MSLQGCKTPLYVLREDGRIIGPDIAQAPAGKDTVAIYGFSGKVAFDVFVASSQRDLRPYPLMKSYLKKRLDEEAEATQIMALDVAGPTESSILAATMDNVLAARTAGLEHLECDFRLTYSVNTRSYTLASPSP